MTIRYQLDPDNLPIRRNEQGVESVRSEDVIDAQPMMKVGKFKQGYHDATEKLKADLIEGGLELTERELYNWGFRWFFHSGWELNITNMYLFLRARDEITELICCNIKDSEFDDRYRYNFKDNPEWENRSCLKGHKCETYLGDLIIHPKDSKLDYDVEVKGRWQGGGKLINFNHFYPERAQRMIFIVRENSQAHKALRRYRWVNQKYWNQQFLFYEQLGRQMQGLITWE